MSHDSIRQKAKEYWEENKERFEKIVSEMNEGKGPLSDVVFPVSVSGGVIDQLCWSFDKKRFTEIRLTCGVGESFFDSLHGDSGFFNKVRYEKVEL